VLQTTNRKDMTRTWQKPWHLDKKESKQSRSTAVALYFNAKCPAEI